MLTVMRTIQRLLNCKIQAIKSHETSDLYPYHILLITYVARKYFLPLILENVLQMLENGKELDSDITKSTQTCETLFDKIRAKIAETETLDADCQCKLDYAIENISIDASKVPKAFSVIDTYIRKNPNNGTYSIPDGLLSLNYEKIIAQFYRLRLALTALRDTHISEQRDLPHLYSTVHRRIGYLNTCTQALLQKDNTTKELKILKEKSELQEKISPTLISLLMNQISDELLKENPGTGDDPKRIDKKIKQFLKIKCDDSTDNSVEIGQNSLQPNAPPTSLSSTGSLEQEMLATPAIRAHEAITDRTCEYATL